MLRTYFIIFETPYHVGWREPEAIIDHSTILRALISVASSIGDEKLVNAVKELKVRASAVLPTAKGEDGRVRLLAPLPVLPRMVRLSKLGIKWATLTAVRSIALFATRCAEAKGVPYVASARGGAITIRCTGSDDVLELRYGRGVVKPGGEPSIAEEPQLRRVLHYFNVIDRATGSADLYPFAGFEATSPMWIAVDAPNGFEQHIEPLLSLLGELGIGGRRSRGWGRFRVVDLDAYGDDVEVLKRYGTWTRDTYNVVLGCTLNGFDRRRSFVATRSIGGRAGPPYDEHLLPFMILADVGSTLYASEPSPATTISIDGSYVGSTIILNPIAVSGAEQR